MPMVRLERKYLLFFLLAGLLLATNFSLYRVPWTAPLPDNIGWASLFDLMLILPLLFYLLIFKGNKGWKAIIPLMFLGYGLSWLIIPKPYWSDISQAKYILLALEGIFIAGEMFLLVLLLKKTRLIKRHMKQESGNYFGERLHRAVSHEIGQSRIIDVFTAEIAMFYYAFFSWRKKPEIGDNKYTLHKKTSIVAFYIMLIHAMVIETIGLHFFLHQWNPVLSWILLVFNIYGLILFLAEIQVIRLVPAVLTSEKLTLQVGVMKRMEVEIENIESFAPYDGPEKLSKKEQATLFDGVLVDFIKEKPQFEIKLKEPVKAKLLYGFFKTVDTVHLTVDDPSAFAGNLKKYMEAAR